MARATAAKGCAQLQSTLEQFPHRRAWHSRHTPESLRSASIPAEFWSIPTESWSKGAGLAGWAVLRWVWIESLDISKR
jgi:hypothetical protein